MEPQSAFMNAQFYHSSVSGQIGLFNNYDGSVDLLLTANKNTVLHIFITSHKAGQSISFVDQVLDKCPSLLFKQNIKGETPLHIAARHGHDDIVNILIRRAKAQPHEDVKRCIVIAKELMRMTSLVKETALHEAARLNHVKVVRILIREDSDFVHQGNVAGETPIYLAAERGCREIVFDILETCKSIQHSR